MDRLDGIEDAMPVLSNICIYLPQEFMVTRK